MSETKKISNSKFFFLKLYYSIRFLRYIRTLQVIRNYFYDGIVVFRDPNTFPMYCWNFKNKKWDQIA